MSAKMLGAGREIAPLVCWGKTLEIRIEPKGFIDDENRFFMTSVTKQKEKHDAETNNRSSLFIHCGEYMGMCLCGR